VAEGEERVGKVSQERLEFYEKVEEVADVVDSLRDESERRDKDIV